MRKLIFLVFTFAVVSRVFPAPLEELVGAATAARLLSQDSSVTEYHLKNPVLKMVPANAALRRFIAEMQAGLEPTVAVETLYLYKKPSGSGAWNDTQKTALFNQITALSTLTGIEYYSASRKTMRTFYEFSGLIDGAETKNPIADPVFTSLPAALTVFARQKDLTFGDNIYRYDFLTNNEFFLFSLENLTPLNYGIIPAVGKNRLKSVFAVIDCGDSMLIYAVNMAKAASVPGMGDRIGNSFGNRADAILKWFKGRADKVFSL
jgi:hypothetical protein